MLGMAERVEVVVIGAGQAGLAASHELTQRGIEHVLLERNRVGQSWRTRWESFCLSGARSRPWPLICGFRLRVRTR
jgi:putative flavoprotein involved in K+ transport